MWQWTQKPQKFVINGKAINWIIHSPVAKLFLSQMTNQSKIVPRQKQREAGRRALAWGGDPSQRLWFSRGHSCKISRALKYSWQTIRCLWPSFFLIRDLSTFELQPEEWRCRREATPHAYWFTGGTRLRLQIPRHVDERPRSRNK